MKKSLFFLFIFLHFGGKSQDLNQLNKWSIALNFGIHDGQKPAQGHTILYQPQHIGLNGRYMLNQYFGVSADLGYDFFDFIGMGALNTHYLRSTFQMDVNAGEILEFNTWTKRIGLHIQTGAGYSYMWRNNVKSSTSLEAKSDEMLNFLVGITPLIKLSERISLAGNLSFIVHGRQDYTFDMNSYLVDRHGFDAYFFNVTIGLNYYFGKHSNHADWAHSSKNGDVEIEMIKEDINSLEEKIIDDDLDGVPNYIDIEPDTKKGSFVNSKGQALIDTDNDGIADQYDLCPTLSGLYSLDGCVDTDNDGIGDLQDVCPTSSGFIQNKGCPEISKEVNYFLNNTSNNIQFEIDRSVLTPAAIASLNELVLIMNSNPELNIALHGYTDNLGDAEFHLLLFKERIQAIKTFLVTKGILETRINSIGLVIFNSQVLKDLENVKSEKIEYKIDFE
ncbi:MAG: hypothetical protein RI883_978 [Bacteroidota bacterium]|jgi:OOP family OmpA-OmpF porin